MTRHLRILWHRVRGHHVRDLGAPLGHHRVWCYDCYSDLVHWPPNEKGNHA